MVRGEGGEGEKGGLEARKEEEALYSMLFSYCSCIDRKIAAGRPVLLVWVLFVCSEYAGWVQGLIGGGRWRFRLAVAPGRCCHCHYCHCPCMPLTWNLSAAALRRTARHSLVSPAVTGYAGLLWICLLACFCFCIALLYSILLYSDHSRLNTTTATRISRTALARTRRRIHLLLVYKRR